MTILVDATTLIALGTVGEPQLLVRFDRGIVICPAVRAEVTTEPARTSVDRFLETAPVRTAAPDDESVERALALLGDGEPSGDAHLVASILQRSGGASVVLVSDDRRLRELALGLDAQVTGTVGVLVRAVHAGLEASTAKDLVRRLDGHGIHMTGELRERADELIEEAAE